MKGESLHKSILRTKLHRPRVPENHVYRGKLVQRLQNYIHRPAILISAPAGYGKSTLVSSWLGTCGYPGVWLSLDDADNDLKIFLLHFVAAVQKMFPEAAEEASALVGSPNSPTLQSITNHLINELDTIETDFILVLDDIHCIRETSIHDFLDSLLLHPPRHMHLVMIGRRDPFLSIPVLRARSQIGEIRLNDLKFTESETATFLERMLETPIVREDAAAWTEKMEGWITGLRLAVLSVRNLAEVKYLPVKLEGGAQYVMEYLFSEVLSRQTPVIRDYLLKTSILNRFSAALCDAVCVEADEQELPPEGAWGFIRYLKKENLFLIHLDDQNEWFRFHQLFQELLQNQLRRLCSPEEIASLHSRAGEWFESHGFITESIQHAAAAGDFIRAAEIVENHRSNEYEADRWHVVKRWLRMLPENVREKRLKLLLADAWIKNCQHRLNQTRSILKKAEPLLRDQMEDAIATGEYSFFRGYVLYFEGRAEASLRFLEDAASKLAGTKNPVLGESELMLGLAHCMTGRKELAVSELKNRIDSVDMSESYRLSRLIAGLIFIYQLSGELFAARPAARQLLLLSKSRNMRVTEAWSYYFLGFIDLQAGELKNASRNFEHAVEMRYVLEPRASLDAMAGLAITLQLMGMEESAEEICRQLERFAMEMNPRNYLCVARSCKARIAVLRNDLGSAKTCRRSVGNSPVADELWSWLETPRITHARTLIAEGGENGLDKAAGMLKKIRRECETNHISCQALEAEVLLSMAMEKMGKKDEAMESLKRAISMAAPLGWLRPFIEAESLMIDLLKRLQGRKTDHGFIHKILTFASGSISRADRGDISPDMNPPRASQTPPTHRLSSQPLVEPLTNRELDILELLSERLQNKEIASRLTISPATVKTHLKNIFQKLGVGNRRDAVRKARRLAII